jgi:hypothetical protein
MNLEEIRADLMVRHCSMQSDQHRPDLIEYEVIEHELIEHELIRHEAPLPARQLKERRAESGRR